MGLPTVVTVPCFAGAPWDLPKLTTLAAYPLCTRRQRPRGLLGRLPPSPKGHRGPDADLDYDHLIGGEAAQVLVDGIPLATEVVLKETGHMFRFSHPVTYSRTIRDFISTGLESGSGSSVKSA